MKRFLKVFFFTLIVPLICIHHGFIILIIRNKEKRTKALVRSLQNYCRYGLKILQFELICDFKHDAVGNSLIIANHLSYMDVLCLSSVLPASYVTSVEMKNTPILGEVCQLSACLFTERRRSKRNNKTHEKEIGQMKEYLKNGVNIVLFPESTTSPGDTVMPFKTSLLESGIQSKSVFQPMALCYSSRKVAWFGDDLSFASHLWTMAGEDKIRAYLVLGGPIYLDEGEGRKEIGLRLHSAVTSLFEKCNFLMKSSEQSV
jgi:1-acyl-sn-glycerol-3-phosphate acyltransferase